MAALAFVEFATEALLYQVVQTVAQGDESHVVDDLIDEGVLQEQLGFLKGYASLTDYGNMLTVKLSYRLDRGRKYRDIQRTMNHSDSETGILSNNGGSL